jgi:hypothetical protein
VFEPAIKDGKPVPVALDLVVSFRIYSKRTSQTGPQQATEKKPDERILPGPYTARASVQQQAPQQDQPQPAPTAQPDSSQPPAQPPSADPSAQPAQAQPQQPQPDQPQPAPQQTPPPNPQ